LQKKGGEKMHNKCSQTGSAKARFLKLPRFLWVKISKFGKLSLAGSWNAVKQAFRWIAKLSWLKLLKAIKLIIEIIDETRSLLSCDQTAYFVQVVG